MYIPLQFALFVADNLSCVAFVKKGADTAILIRFPWPPTVPLEGGPKR